MADISKIQIESGTYDIKDLEARNNINTINNNINTINTNIGDLNNLNTTNKDNLVNAINEVNSNQDNLQTKLTNLVIFGDSWSDKNIENNVYPNILGQTLHLTVNNYAVNGGGFVHPTNNLISTQVQTFLDDETVDKTKVKYVLFFGGINDYRQNTTSTELTNEIVRLVNIIKNNCPNAKIVYASNCQYPYDMEQSYYWERVHSYLSTSAYITTYNLDGTVGIELYDDTYFHLSVNGQEWLSRNFLAVLTGGQIFSYPDIRDFSDSDMKVRISTTRIGNFILISFKFKTLQSFSQHTLPLSNSDIGIPWVNSTQVLGFTDGDYNNIAYALRNKSIVVNAGNVTLNANNTYETSIMIPIVNNVEL